MQESSKRAASSSRCPCRKNVGGQASAGERVDTKTCLKARSSMLPEVVSSSPICSANRCTGSTARYHMPRQRFVNQFQFPEVEQILRQGSVMFLLLFNIFAAILTIFLQTSSENTVILAKLVCLKEPPTSMGPETTMDYVRLEVWRIISRSPQGIAKMMESSWRFVNPSL